jgi:Holliday junction resolvase RusA-like endonuclease
MPAEYQEWKRQVRAHWGNFSVAGPVRVEIVLFKYRKNADLDNYAKAILDALSGVAFEDDNCTCVRDLNIWICEDGQSEPDDGFSVEVMSW